MPGWLSAIGLDRARKARRPGHGLRRKPVAAPAFAGRRSSAPLSDVDLTVHERDVVQLRMLERVQDAQNVEHGADPLNPAAPQGET